ETHDEEDQKRCPGVGELPLMDEGKEQRSDNRAEGESEVANGDGEEESAEEKFFRQWRHEKTEGHHQVNVDGLDEIFVHGQLFGNRKEMPDDLCDQREDDASKREGKHLCGGKKIPFDGCPEIFFCTNGDEHAHEEECQQVRDGLDGNEDEWARRELLARKVVKRGKLWGDGETDD